MRSLARSGFGNTGFAVFKLREYRLFWIAAAFSNVGMWTLIYGRLWLMRSLTESELMLGLVTAATQVPILIFTLWGGVLADRVNRLRVLQITRLLFAAAGFLTAVLIAADAMNEWILIGIATATGTMLAFDIPARSAMVASIVDKDQLPSAISLYAIVFGGAAIIGPTLFHPIVSLAGMDGVFAIVAASYVLTVLTLLRMSPEPHRRAGPLAGKQDSPHAEDGGASASADRRGIRFGALRSRLEELVDGLRYVQRNPAIAYVIAYGILIGVIGSPVETLLPVVTDEVFDGGTATYSRFLLFIGIGGIVATLGITLIGRRANPAQYLAAAGVLIGLAYVAFAFVGLLALAFAVASVIGLLAVVKGTMSTTVVQTLASDEYRGRVMSLMMFTWGAQAAGAVFMGGIAELASAPTAFAIGGVLVVVATASVWALALRKL